MVYTKCVCVRDVIEPCTAISSANASEYQDLRDEGSRPTLTSAMNFQGLGARASFEMWGKLIVIQFHL